MFNNSYRETYSDFFIAAALFLQKNNPNLRQAGSKTNNNRNHKNNHPKLPNELLAS